MFVRKNDRITEYLEQCWRNPLSTTATVSSRKLYELYEQKVITAVDLKIIKFLLNFHIATLEQICKSIDDYNEESVQKRLNFLLKQRIINQFMLHDGGEMRVNDEALLFYTIDQGGIVLMQLLDEDSNAANFRLDTIIGNSSKVNRKLLANDFYLTLKESTKGRLEFFVCDPILSVDGQRVFPKGVFGVKSQESGDVLPFMVEVLRDEDMSLTKTITSFQRRVSVMERIQKSNAWKKYFNSEKEPLIMVLCDTVKTAERIAELLSLSTECDFRLVVGERFDAGLDKSIGKWKEDKLVFKRAKLFSEN